MDPGRWKGRSPDGPPTHLFFVRCHHQQLDIVGPTGALVAKLVYRLDGQALRLAAGEAKLQGVANQLATGG